MKNQLIATLVAGLLLFVWQFLSWSLLSVHADQFQHTDQQDTIMQVLSQHLKEGTYMIPLPKPGSSQEEHQAFMENQGGKPWAFVSYHASMSTDMGMNMFRGFAVDLVAAFLLIWLLLKVQNLDFKTALLSSLAVGGIGYLTIPYLNSIWFDNNSMGYLIDWLVQWGVVGAWLGWWLTRK